MKNVALLLVALFIFSCGDEEMPNPVDFNVPDSAVASGPEVVNPYDPAIVNKGIYDGLFAEAENATIRWEIRTNCGKVPGIPKVMFYDQQSKETFGPYDIDTAKKSIEIDCKRGNKVCWGAWMGRGNYYDCSKVDEIGYCFYVEWSPECHTWSCGKDCSKYGVPDWYCPTCYDRSYSKNIFLSCGDYYNE